MPIYEFKCTNENCGYVQEEILPIKDANIQTATCNKCNYRAEKIFSIPATAVFAPSTLVFRNPTTGDIKLLAREKDKYSPPKGYIVEEHKGSIGRSKLEKELSQRQHAENEVVTEERRQMRNQSMKNRHDEIKANLGKLDHQSQSLMEAAMKRTKKKELPKKNTEFKFDVNHLDKGNMVQG